METKPYIMEVKMNKPYIVVGFALSLTRLSKKRKQDKEEELDYQDEEFMNAIEKSNEKVIVVRKDGKLKNQEPLPPLIYFGVAISKGTSNQTTPETLKIFAEMLMATDKFEPILFTYKNEPYKLHDFSDSYRHCRLIPVCFCTQC